jgi:hypothetical protein
VIDVAGDADEARWAAFGDVLDDDRLGWRADDDGEANAEGLAASEGRTDGFACLLAY